MLCGTTTSVSSAAISSLKHTTMVLRSLTFQLQFSLLWVATSTAFTVMLPPPSSTTVFVEQVVPAPTTTRSMQYNGITGTSWIHAADGVAFPGAPNIPNTPASPRMKPSTPSFTQPAAGYGPDAVPALAGNDPQPPGFVPTNCDAAAAFPKATLLHVCPSSAL